ncbi:MAG TPA: DUF368 domain-containing protein [Firmicutes bacterium]|nr:DUF368 domain-containing protein [Bacillota bacterium]
MKKLWPQLQLFLKGIAIGIATLVPGVSGGTMAILLGVYDRMIHAVSSLWKNLKANLCFLGILGCGGLVGILLFSRLLEWAMASFHFPMIYLFLGIICGGIPVLYRKTRTPGRKLSDLLYLAVGAVLVVLMTMQPTTLFQLATGNGWLNAVFLVFAGVIVAVALILPGISTSFMLLMLGLYDLTLDAVNTLNLFYLVPLLGGVLLGVLGTARILENLLNKYPEKTYMLILGFVLGSLPEVFPGIPQDIATIIFSLLAFALGFSLIRLMQFVDPEANS